MRVIYSAAPFDLAAVRAVLPHVTLLMLNEVEAAALRRTMGALPQVEIVITKGRHGAAYLAPDMPDAHTPAFAVRPVDTTGAGDCFAGALAAGLDAGLLRAAAMRRAAAAAAIQVTRPGAALAMPSAAEVDDFLSLAGK